MNQTLDKNLATVAAQENVTICFLCDCDQTKTHTKKVTERGRRKFRLGDSVSSRNVNRVNSGVVENDRDRDP